MNITKAISDWFQTCPGISNIDIAQVQNAGVGIYKQPSLEVEKLIDGGEIRTEYYYALFMMDAQIKKDRIDNEEVLQNVEEWIFDQEMAENYPEIGYPVYEIAATGSRYMMNRDDQDATYQITIKIKYERKVKQ